MKEKRKKKKIKIKQKMKKERDKACCGEVQMLKNIKLAAFFNMFLNNK